MLCSVYIYNVTCIVFTYKVMHMVCIYNVVYVVFLCVWICTVVFGYVMS